jgi:hypothetical protein
LNNRSLHCGVLFVRLASAAIVRLGFLRIRVFGWSLVPDLNRGWKPAGSPK